MYKLVCTQAETVIWIKLSDKWLKHSAIDQCVLSLLIWIPLLQEIVSVDNIRDPKVYKHAIYVGLNFKSWTEN